MSTAAAANATPLPPAKGKKKLIIIIAVAVLVLAIGGVGAVLLLKKKAAPHEGDGEDAPAPAAVAAKHATSAAPTFVPLEPFTVNLADREADHYAQVGITLEVEDGKVADQIKVFMPAIRDRILMAIADSTSGDLLGREGKMRLAETVRRESSRVLGFEVPKLGAGGAKAAELALPVRAVHFSNFIIQ